MEKQNWKSILWGGAGAAIVTTGAGILFDFYYDTAQLNQKAEVALLVNQIKGDYFDRIDDILLEVGEMKAETRSLLNESKESAHDIKTKRDFVDGVVANLDRTYSSEEIAKALQPLIEPRIATQINERVADIHYVEKGYWQERNNKEGGGCVHQNSYEWKKTVQFNSRFAKPPIVHAALSFLDFETADTSNRTNGVHIRVQRVSESHITLVANQWMGCNYKFGVSWIAIGTRQ